MAWIRRFILFHDKRHPSEMGAPEVQAYVTSLATERNVAASTQNQALAAILFLYQNVLNTRLPWLDEIIRASRPARLSGGEVDDVPQHAVPEQRDLECELLLLVIIHR
jgi:hypothetical protein